METTSENKPASQTPATKTPTQVLTFTADFHGDVHCHQGLVTFMRGSTMHGSIVVPETTVGVSIHVDTLHGTLQVHGANSTTTVGTLNGALSATDQTVVLTPGTKTSDIVRKSVLDENTMLLTENTKLKAESASLAEKLALASSSLSRAQAAVNDATTRLTSSDPFNSHKWN
jgi:hypothetical protein